MFEQIKSHLLNSIDDIVSDANQFVRQPEKDFSRNSPLTMKTMLKSLLALGGKSLAKELLDLDLPVSQSAFVQRRYQIKFQAFERLFRDFTAKIPTVNPMLILAVDGSDVILPRNRFDKSTCIQTGANRTPYNLTHINALYDLENGVYCDLRIQDKVDHDERAAFIDMMENSPFRTSTCHHG